MEKRKKPILMQSERKMSSSTGHNSQYSRQNHPSTIHSASVLAMLPRQNGHKNERARTNGNISKNVYLYTYHSTIA